MDMQAYTSWWSQVVKAARIQGVPTDDDVDWAGFFANGLAPDDALHAAVRARVDFVKSHLPEMIPLIKAMFDEGMILGWRSVTNCRLLDAP